jgi:hypothetical protein
VGEGQGKGVGGKTDASGLGQQVAGRKQREKKEAGYVNVRMDACQG